MSQAPILPRYYLDWILFYFAGQLESPHYFSAFFLIAVLNAEINWTNLLFSIRVFAFILICSCIWNLNYIILCSSLCSLFVQFEESIPAGTWRPEDVPLWSYFGRDVLDHNRTKIGRMRFLNYFGSAMSGMHLPSRNIEKFP